MKYLLLKRKSDTFNANVKQYLDNALEQMEHIYLELFI
jgi:hypothetical protein